MIETGHDLPRTRIASEPWLTADFSQMLADTMPSGVTEASFAGWYSFGQSRRTGAYCRCGPPGASNKSAKRDGSRHRLPLIHGSRQKTVIILATSHWASQWTSC